MHSKSNFIYSLIGLCLLGISLFSFIQFHIKKEREYQEVLSLLKEQNTWVKYALTNHIKYSPQTEIAANFFRPNTLVYRYCDDTCEKCVAEDLQALYRLQNKIGKEHVLIVPSFLNNRNNKIRLNQELAEFNYSNIESKQDMPINEETGLHIRYFIYWGNNKNDYYVFFPAKSQAGLTQLFFYLIFKRRKILDCPLK